MSHEDRDRCRSDRRVLHGASDLVQRAHGRRQCPEVLATSLNNLGRDLSNLGRREEALAASQEAVDIYRRLAQTRPDAFLPDLAFLSWSVHFTNHLPQLGVLVVVGSCRPGCRLRAECLAIAGAAAGAILG
jgi:hypothetical protein